MILKFTLIILSIFDYFHKQKIKNFFHKKNIKNFNSIIDIGGHRGETILFFLKHFRVDNIYSFEASNLNFKILEKKVNKIRNRYKNSKIFLENIGIGNKKGILELKQHYESSSSTFASFNINSRYLQKKNKFLNLKENFYKKINVNITSLEDYMNDNNIIKIDLLKIDTEGYEYEVLLGLKKKISYIKFVLFEHHYDDMIKKNYTFADMNNLLVNHNFKKVFKSKMPFRKTFEYVYVNKKLEKL